MYKEKIIYSSWFTGLLFAFWFLIIPPIIAIVLIIKRNKDLKDFQNILAENNIEEIINNKDNIATIKEELKLLTNKKQQIQEEVEKYKPVTDLLEVKEKISNEINELSDKSEALSRKVNDIQMLIDIEESKHNVTLEIESLNNNKQLIVEEVNNLQEEVILLKDELLMQSFGFTNPKYGFESSEVYQNKLNDIRQEQKQLVKEKRATNHSLDWTIGNDKNKGREFILDTIKLTLRAFNNECDNIINKVKYNNIEASEKRIRKVFDDVNKLTDMQSVTITNQYLNLKIEELYLKYEFEQKKQEEKEEQLEIKERMREEAKALKELEKAKEKVEKEERHFEQAIEKLKKQMEETADNQQSKLIEKLKELEKQLEETKKNKEDVLYRVQNTRAGYVYIISNIGSFGENVFKIGMTRRLEPMDRVKELGDASVPFTFDVHGMIFSEDAPALENALHKAFADRRLNRVNERKEFFRVDLKEIENVVKKNHNKTVEFTKLAEAEEYRKSVQIEKKSLQVV
ncbi:DUF4041 domain-containing protein [Metabacillus niabensis]|uniref:DNA repair exonuclease SbcCD ATPase subunit n=1 Tax=Metabacillus niabensis TaxID=324854 RepID=A0ABT9ZAF3_9BACI|nr:DUF4041 domain-containing protein [Metabacillus niabensis]MDQ0228603.1 DNA repair exonuclease SbcCD ATPase subunit [Metabacillus niabensis]